MTFGPISIAPGYKRQGYGKRLLDYSMEKARDMGAKALAITGNIDFYGKSGFVVASTKGIRYADADPDDTVVPYFLIKELETGFLDSITGTYHDPESYLVAERDPEGFEAFEARFPPKEKKKLPARFSDTGQGETRYVYFHSSLRRRSGNTLRYMVYPSFLRR